MISPRKILWILGEYHVAKKLLCLAKTSALRQKRNFISENLYIGSAHAEKANDLIVARRQKHKGMHWSEKTADGLAALKTLTLNGAWELYWTERKVLALAANA
jgi:hypothetical protein